MTTQQREAFERCHVVPDDATYNAKADEYRHSQHPGVNHPVNELYESFQDGWQAAQAQQGAEPVAFWDGDTGEAETAFQFEQDSIYTTPVYTHPQPAQQVRGDGEPVAFWDGDTVEIPEVFE